MQNNPPKILKIKNSRPALFEKTASNIWTDPYIQQNMLKAHLDLSSDAASRKSESIDKIVEFIHQQINNRGHILDLGCGPGLYTERLAKIGYAVTGIDFNKKAIEYAASRNNEIHYIEGDYILDFPHGRYDAIIMIYCDMGTHSDQDRDVLLKNCYQSLEKGGKLIFDVFNEKITDDKTEGSTWDYNPDGGFWSESAYLILKQCFHYHQDKAFADQYNLISDEHESKHFIIWDRYYSENEITQILEKIGFKNVRIVTDLLNSNNFTSSNEMFIIAEK